MATSVDMTTPPISGAPTENDEEMEQKTPEPQSTEKVDFNLPGSVKIEKGEKKDIVVTIEGYGDGKACMTAIQGVPLGEEKKEGKLDKYKDLKGRSPGDRFAEMFRPQGKQLRMNKEEE